jgi:hypothetical protein
LQYLKLCSVSFFHHFFSNHVYRELKMTPTVSCVKLLQENGLILKEIAGEYLLINRVEENNKSVLKVTKEPLRLSFTIHCTDNLLLNYSDLTLSDMNYGYLLTNRDKESKNLHESSCISDKEKVLLVPNFQLLDTYIFDKTEQLRLTNPDENQTEIFQGTFEDLKNTLSFSNMLEKGRFNVYLGENLDPIKCYAIVPSSKKIFGVLEMDIYPEMASDLEFSYSATIGSKSVFWRYHIINKEQVAYSNFKLFSGKNKVTIEEASQTVLSTGHKAYVLETSDSITMAERYDSHYELEFVKEDIKSGQVISKKRIGLPVPEINRIKISKNDSGYKAYSDMFIYV